MSELQTINLADGRIEIAAYPNGDDVQLNINVDGVCVHQIRLQNIAGADFNAMKANGMVLPHLVPIGDVDAFLKHCQSAFEAG